MMHGVDPLACLCLLHDHSSKMRMEFILMTEDKDTFECCEYCSEVLKDKIIQGDHGELFCSASCRELLRREEELLNGT